jgi:hypothetical protein
VAAYRGAVETITSGGTAGPLDPVHRAAERRSGRLRIKVHDDGAGTAPDVPAGVGPTAYRFDPDPRRGR